MYPEKRSKNALNTTEKDLPLQGSIREIRHSLVNNLSFLGDAYEVSRGYYHHGLGKSKQLYDNLTDEKEQTTKIIAIASGGLFGLMFSFRKSIFKKILHVSFFTGAIAAFCYPNKAKEYSNIAIYITKNKIPPVVKGK